FCAASPSCRMLFEHFSRDAAERTFWTAGKRTPTKMAITAITVSNSTSVKPALRPLRGLPTCMGIFRGGVMVNAAGRPESGSPGKWGLRQNNRPALSPWGQDRSARKELLAEAGRSGLVLAVVAGHEGTQNGLRGGLADEHDVPVSE